MSTPTSTELLKFANLQMAAEAFLADAAGNIIPATLLQGRLTAGNKQASKFPKQLANDFAEHWEVLAQKPNTNTGFSGTLFKCIKDDVALGYHTGELVLSFRSTEFIDDAARDNQETNAMEIRNSGFAFGQIADMEAWYRELNNDPAMLKGKNFSVTGYSLGGHLATAFYRLRRDEGQDARITQTFTFNGAGIGQIKQLWRLDFDRAGKFAEIIATFDRQRQNADGAQITFAQAPANQIYLELRTFYDGTRVPTVDEINTIVSKFSAAGVAVDVPRRVVAALRNIRDLAVEATRVDSLLIRDGSGALHALNTGILPGIDPVTHLSYMDALRLDYQMAVSYAGEKTRPVDTGLVSGGLNLAFAHRVTATGDLYRNFYDAWGDTYPTMVASSQEHHGTSMPIYIEDQPLYRGTVVKDAAAATLAYLSPKLLVDDPGQNDFGDTHSLVLLVDSLSVQQLFERLCRPSDRLDAKSLAQTFRAATTSHKETSYDTQGKAEGDTLETVLDALRRLIAGPGAAVTDTLSSNDGNTWWLERLRDPFQANIATLRNDIDAKGLAEQFEFQSLAFNSPGYLAQQAASGGSAWIYALRALNPFVLDASGAAARSLYAQYDSDGSFSLASYSPNGQISKRWVEDRAALLAGKLLLGVINATDLGEEFVRRWGRPGVYSDLASGLTVRTAPESLTQVKFGTGGAENGVTAIAGGSADDRLYGEGGDDQLFGYGGKDYLEGGAGNDILTGGAGLDTYGVGLGADTILDDDGILEFVQGFRADGAYTLQADGTYANASVAGLTARKAGADLVLQYRAAEVRIRDFNDGAFGIALADTPARSTAAPTAPSSGDLANHTTYTRFGPRGGNELIVGSNAADGYVNGSSVGMYGEGGADTIFGFDGGDVIQGGYKIPGPGDDAGDYIDGGAGNDLVGGDDGDDTLIGGTGADFLLGGTGRDVLVGSDLTGLADADRLSGGPGDDRVYASLLGLSADAQAQAVRQAVNPGVAAIQATGVWAQGDAGDDLVVGSAAYDLIMGGEGDDALYAGAGSDIVLGDGQDLVPPTAIPGGWQARGVNATINYYWHGDKDVFEFMRDQPWSVMASTGTLRVPTYFPMIYLGFEVTDGAGNDVIDAGTGNDWVMGQHGNDRIQGGAGNDYLDGGQGADVIEDSGGNDIIYGDTPRDMLRASYAAGTYDEDLGPAWSFHFHYHFDLSDAAMQAEQGDDFIDAGNGDDLVFGEGGNDQIYGGTGSDNLNGDDTVLEDRYCGNDYIDGGAGDDQIRGNAGDDEIYGGEGQDFLDGGAGNDVLSGGGGNDQISGGSGNDRLYGEEGDDTLAGGLGNDYYDAGAGRNRLYDAGGDDQYLITAFSEGDQIVDDGGNDTLVFGPDLAVLRFQVSGRGRDRTLVARFSDGSQRNIVTIRDGEMERVELPDGSAFSMTDWMATLETTIDIGDDGGEAVGGDWADTLRGGDGADSASGRGGNDTIFGGAGNDFLDGGDGDDLISGSWGNDTIIGGRGSDTLNGGPGSDTYRWGLGDGDDTIIDSDYGLCDSTFSSYLVITSGTPEITRDRKEWKITLRESGETMILRDSQMDSAEWSAVHDPYCPVDVVQVVATGVQIPFQALYALPWRGTAGDDVMEGYLTHTNTIYGGDGNDVISDGQGPDELYGENGNDTLVHRHIVGARTGTRNSGLIVLGRPSLHGGTGDDTYIVADDNVSIYEENGSGGGIDTIQAYCSWAFLPESVENLILSGSGNIDGRGNARSNVITGNSGSNHLSGGAGADWLEGGAGDDVLDVDAGIWDTAGDEFYGGTGNDQLFGGFGADTYYFQRGDGADVIVEAAGSGAGTGEDRIVFGPGISPGDIVLEASGADLVIKYGDQDSITIRQWYDDVRHEIERVVFADGRLGALNAPRAQLAGGAGDDRLVGGRSGDELQGLDGNDSLYGLDARDVLYGGRGDDLLDGGAAADRMLGGLGNDGYLVDDIGDTVVELAGEGQDTVSTRVDAYLLPAEVENLVLAEGVISGTGNTGANRIIGNELDNFLDGAGGADWISGGAGNDTYVIDDAGDVVVESAGAGNMDRVLASVSYRLPAQVEYLTLVGLGAIDGYGNELANYLVGNDAANLLDGSGGPDQMAGGKGDDIYIVDSASDWVLELAGEGSDSVRASVSYSLSANVENLELTGASDINGIGNALANVLRGNGGANLLDGGAGADVMAGGAGDDQYIVDNAGDVLVELADGGIDLVRSSVSYTLPDNIEKLVLTGNAALSGTGNALGNQLTGNSKANTLSGGAGDDLLDGGVGADTMYGGSGNDEYWVDNVSDKVIEVAGGGFDTVRSTVTLTLAANVENGVLLGTAAVNATGNVLNNSLTGNSAANILDGRQGADVLSGGGGNDIYIVDNAGDTIVELPGGGTDEVRSSVSFTLPVEVEKLSLTGSGAINATGNAAANVLTGNGGANLLDGGAGADTMTGGVGDDTYVVDNSADKVVEVAGQGRDTVRASISYSLGANVENLVLTGTAGISGTGNALDNVLTGNSGANVLNGGDGNDRLDGGAGADRMSGQAGDDTYVVDNSGDVVVEFAGQGLDTILASISCTLSANVENLELTGSDATSAIGNVLANQLTGNSAGNILDGGYGEDRLVGGGGNDTYRFGRNYGHDTIIENDATPGNLDLLQFLGGIRADQIWLQRPTGTNNLDLSIVGTDDHVTIMNWYAGSRYRVESIRTVDGNRNLAAADVEKLVSAMAAFAPPAAGTVNLPSTLQTALNPVIAANWH
ncbi:MAG: hypothetical protein KF778_18050 [Rhodocyclaceae bacterium]|nr:hypothetical protein [Rhodocyclaceae bacterium]MBX3670307.1 hypothetical protein [Rhodocyclaceae bacterium]